MPVVFWLVIIPGAVFVWVTGSFVVHAWIKRGWEEEQKQRKERGLSYDSARFDITTDTSGWQVFYILAWPLVWLVFIPGAIGAIIGRKAWVRVHRAELIQNELRNEEAGNAQSRTPSF